MPYSIHCFERPYYLLAGVLTWAMRGFKGRGTKWSSFPNPGSEAEWGKAEEPPSLFISWGDGFLYESGRNQRLMDEVFGSLVPAMTRSPSIYRFKGPPKLRQKPNQRENKKQWLDRQKLTFKANKRHFRLGKSHSCNVSLEVQEKFILFRSESDWFCPPSSGISLVNRHVRLYFRYCIAEEMRALTFNLAYSLMKWSS